MKTKLKKRAISTILTTVIILVASVVLGSGVVLYGTSLFQSSTLTESIVVSGTKVWVDPTDSGGQGGHAWGAAGIRNNGDKIVSFDKISVRGIDVPFTSWFVTTNQTQASVENTQASFSHSGVAFYEITGEMGDTQGTLTTAVPEGCTSGDFANEIIIDVDGDGSAPTMCLLQQTGPISLSPGDRAVVYFQVINNTLNPIDAGANTSVNLFAGKTGAPLSLTVAKTP